MDWMLLRSPEPSLYFLQSCLQSLPPHIQKAGEMKNEVNSASIGRKHTPCVYFINQVRVVFKNSHLSNSLRSTKNPRKQFQQGTTELPQGPVASL